jgi:amino acid adenylation domain-containing protein
MDGWSMRIIAGEITTGYRMAFAGGAISLGDEPNAFIAHAARHRSWIDGGGADTQVAWWTRRLAGHRGMIELPLDFPRPAKPSSHGALESRTLDSRSCERIARLAATCRATPFMVHLAAFLLLLRQHGAGDDPVVAIPVANRHLPGTDGLVGTLVNTLPFRFDLPDGGNFTTLLERIRQETLAMLDNQDAPFERIIDAVKPERGPDHPPIAQVMFDHQEMPIAECWPDGVICRPAIIHRGGTQFDLSMLVNVFPDHQQLAMEYRTDLFRPETIASMLDRHLAVLERICDDPHRRIADMTRPSADDLRFLDAVSFGPARPDFTGTPVPELIARRVALHPDRCAVSDASGNIDYGTLGGLSGQVAAALRKSGLEPGMRIAILLERDRFLPAVLLAVWKCGATYVPLDPSNPKPRMELILSDQAPIRVLVSASLTGLLPEGADALVYESLPLASIPHGPVETTGTAYVIHTSGSTGKPKGVAVGHRALANFLRSMAETPGFTEADHLLAVTTVSFDISLLELFLPLITGGRVTIARSGEAADAAALASRIGSDGITVMQATPATWRLLLDSGWKGSPALKILCGGEAMDAGLARRLASTGCQLWNLYGPTETTVWSTCWRVPEDFARIQIGGPIANTGIHVLGPDGSARPPGVTGELWISGEGLADGYWNDPALTATRFRTITGHSGRQITAYSTGDLARWTPGGGLECHGRLDGQVKVRGFRVELGEIEAALASHPAVSQARVALRGDKPETVRLLAWVTLRGGDDRTIITRLRPHLSARLPSHMIPADIGVLASFPLGASGKVDLSQLSDPAPSPRPAEETDESTARMIAIWNGLLGRADVHPDDDWFHIGGHSLLALRLFARIHGDFGKQLPLSAILDHSTPRALARLIAEPPETHRA